ncbi:DUF1552 domain-containing protein [Lignipirellula cremea]|uniref:DUF1552 domain-containing protein n=1 Tax=Lignipirellula cremea TaxID=2528010 RepID=UPI001E3F7252|nr:DUF1552 domain-containing protein [Lignipirellula cremea]
MNRAKKALLSRRTMLKGAGALVALPYLEAMMPSSVYALPTPVATPRLGMFYFGMGMNMRQFTPTDFGPQFTLPRILQPLEEHRGQFTVLSGTYLQHGGGHQGTYPFATGVPMDKKQGVSVDQLAAEALGQDTRFPSLQMSVKNGTGFGSQVLATLAFNRQGAPLAAENDPSVLFDRLFRPPSKAEKAAEAGAFRHRQSILDLVQEDAARLQKRLGQADRRQMDQYFYSVRELEQQLERRIAWSDKEKARPELAELGDYSQPISPDQPEDFSYEAYSRLMYDLIALAFQTDSTRVATYVVRTELKGGSYPEWSLSRDYHSLTHHGNNPQNLEELARADTIYMRHWSRFLSRLRSIPEGDGTLLDHAALGFSSGMGIGHSRDQLPTMVSGGARLGLHHQGHVGLPPNTPLANLWRTMLDRTGVPVPETFHDSTGVVKELIDA